VRPTAICRVRFTVLLLFEFLISFLFGSPAIIYFNYYFTYRFRDYNRSRLVLVLGNKAVYFARHMQNTIETITELLAMVSKQVKRKISTDHFYRASAYSLLYRCPVLAMAKASVCPSVTLLPYQSDTRITKP